METFIHSARFPNPTSRQQNQTTFFLYSFSEKLSLAAPLLPNALIRLEVPEFISLLSLPVFVIAFHLGEGWGAGPLWKVPQRKYVCWALKNEQFRSKEARVRFLFMRRE